MLGFVCCMIYSFSWIDKIRNEIQPYYIKCTIYKALEWVDGEIPGTVTIGQHEKDLRIRAVTVGNGRQPKTIIMEINSGVKVRGKDNLAILISPNSVLRAGAIEAVDWTITFPPVVTKINIKR